MESFKMYRGTVEYTIVYIIESIQKKNVTQKKKQKKQYEA